MSAQRDRLTAGKSQESLEDQDCEGLQLVAGRAMVCEVWRRGGQADQHRVRRDLQGLVQDDLSQDLLHPARGGSVVSCCQGASAALRRAHVVSHKQTTSDRSWPRLVSSSPTSRGLTPSPSSSTPSPCWSEGTEVKTYIVTIYISFHISFPLVETINVTTPSP